MLLGKLKKDISFALQRGTIAQVTTRALDGYAWPARARPRSSEDEEELLPALNRRAGGLGSLNSLFVLADNLSLSTWQVQDGL